MLIPQPLNQITISITIGRVMFFISFDSAIYSNDKRSFFMPHNHSRYELQLFIDGSCRIHTDTFEYNANPGDLCITHPYEYHSFIRPSNKEDHFTYATISFSYELTESPVSEEFDIAQMFPSLNSTHIIHCPDNTCAELFNKIHTELCEQKPGHLTAVKGYLITMLIKIYQILMTETPNLNVSSLNTNSFDRETQIEYYFMSSFDESPSIDNLADILHVCPRRVNQIIHQLFGCSFSAKLMKTRIEIAKILLIYTQYPVRTVGEMAGFNSSNYFHTSFHKFTDYTPLKFRKNAERLHPYSTENNC